MIFDSRAEFADAVSVAAAASTINVGNVIDLSVVRDVGHGIDLYLVINVDTSIITGGVAGTIQFLLVSDDTATPLTNGTATVHFATGTIVTGGTAAGLAVAGQTVVSIELPQEGTVYERYLGVQAVIATTTTTAGKVNAFLTFDPPTRKTYPRAVN